MKDNESQVEEILTKMRKLLAESRLLKQRHDALMEKYLKLKRELEERTGKQHEDS